MLADILIKKGEEAAGFCKDEIKAQSCKLLRHLGTSCPVGLETISRIWKVYPTLFAVSRILRAKIAFLGYGLIFGHFRTHLNVLKD